MMMPANYSAIAENEMTYVVGGGLLEAIGSVTAPVWGAANVKTFNTNLITIIGNSYVSKVLGATPVSYTHLDVYKRQRSCSGGRSGPLPAPGSAAGAFPALTAPAVPRY